MLSRSREIRSKVGLLTKLFLGFSLCFHLLYLYFFNPMFFFLLACEGKHIILEKQSMRIREKPRHEGARHSWSCQSGLASLSRLTPKPLPSTRTVLFSLPPLPNSNHKWPAQKQNPLPPTLAQLRNPNLRLLLPMVLRVRFLLLVVRLPMLLLNMFITMVTEGPTNLFTMPNRTRLKVKLMRCRSSL